MLLLSCEQLLKRGEGEGNQLKTDMFPKPTSCLGKGAIKLFILMKHVRGVST